MSSDVDTKRDAAMNKRQRKDAILEDLKVELRGLHTRRQRTRFALGSAAVLFALVCAWQFAPQNDSNSNIQATVSPVEFDSDASVESSSTDSTFSGRLSNWISTNSPDVVERYVVSSSELKRSIELTEVDDEELLRLLEEAGRPCHLGTVGGQKIVVPIHPPGTSL